MLVSRLNGAYDDLVSKAELVHAQQGARYTLYTHPATRADPRPDAGQVISTSGIAWTLTKTAWCEYMNQP